jgi:hypothetical protein
LTDGDQAESKHTDRQPDVGLQFLQDDVRGDFKENIWNKKDRESCVVLDAFEIEVFCQTKDGSIGHVGAVKESAVPSSQSTLEKNMITIDLLQ